MMLHYVCVQIISDNIKHDRNKLSLPCHTESVEEASPGSTVHLMDARFPAGPGEEDHDHDYGGGGASPGDHLVISTTFQLCRVILLVDPPPFQY